MHCAPPEHIAISIAYSDSIEGLWKEHQGSPALEGPSAPDIRFICRYCDVAYSTVMRCRGRRRRGRSVIMAPEPVLPATERTSAGGHIKVTENGTVGADPDVPKKTDDTHTF
jgi:hypothetical protein